MMVGLSLQARKRIFVALLCVILVTLLLIFDISGWHLTDIRKHFKHELKKVGGLFEEDYEEKNTNGLFKDLHEERNTSELIKEGHQKRNISGQFRDENEKKTTRGFFKDSVWDRRFHTLTKLYNGGRELQMEMLENITVLTEYECKHKKFLVFKCDSSMLCGGWADRQKGIVSTFLMALLTNRKFVIDMSSPCNLEISLLPNIYNWSLCKAYLNTISKERVSSFNYVDNYKLNQQFDFEGNWKRDAVVIRMNYYAIDGVRQNKVAKDRLKWILDMPNEEVIHLVLNTLFKPSDRLLNDVIYFHNTRVKGKKLICCHIRKGKNPSIPTDSIPPFGPPNETMIFDHLKEYDNNSNYSIYIAADSKQVKQNARSKLKSYINIDRNIVHVDRLGKFKTRKVEACEGSYSAILEQFILSLCDKLILTHSGFGTMAAYMRGDSENLYIYHPQTKQIIETDLKGIQKIFKFHR